jgi:hypothetical protein
MDIAKRSTSHLVKTKKFTIVTGNAKFLFIAVQQLFPDCTGSMHWQMRSREERNIATTKIRTNQGDHIQGRLHNVKPGADAA